MTITEDEINRRLLAEQRQWNDEQELLKTAGSSGGNGQEEKESETPVSDEELKQYQDRSNKTAKPAITEDEDKDEDDKNNKKIELAFKRAEEISKPLFKDQYGVCYGWLDISGHKEILKIESSKFKRLLIKLFYENVGYVPSPSTIDGWVNTFHAFADFEGETHPLSLRVAWHNNINDIIYDLTNDRWQCVKISSEGWTLEDRTPQPLFMRYNQTPQADPDSHYPANIFNQFLGLTNLKNDNDRLLLQVYIISLFIPEIPHVMLVLHGEKGSAKSTLQTIIKMLVDPAKPSLLTVYNDQKEFIQQLAHNHIAFYDNVKHSPRWLSDEACKAVTGIGSTKRKLYSDDDDIVYEYRRCLGFNGINISLTEPDALDRSMMIELERIKRTNALQETEIMSRFFGLRPQLLGYIFDIMSKALAIKSTIVLGDLPRMADFAIWGEAIARAMGYRPMEFIDAYYDNIGKQNIEAIESSSLGQALEIFWRSVYDEEAPSCWQGLTSDILAQLDSIALNNSIHTDHNTWPQSADSLTKKLKVISSNLREGLGINISISKIKSGSLRGRSITKVSQNASNAYTPHQTTFDAQFGLIEQDAKEPESSHIEPIEPNFD